MRFASRSRRRSLPAFTVSIAALTLCPWQASAGTSDWPEYRGPWNNGHVSAPGGTESISLPLTWGETENVAWKVPVPHAGLSTPAIAHGRIWLTTAAVEGHDSFVLCIDSATGQTLIEKNLFHADNPEPLGNSTNTYASPSPVIENGRVYVHFGTYGTACLDAATGGVIWQRNDLPCRHYRGPGSSPIVFEDLLVLTFDGVDQQYLTALNKNTGKTVWRTDRSTEWHDLDEYGNPMRDGDYRKAFSTPLVIEWEGTPQLISLGAAAAFAYEPRTGKEVWKVHHAGHSSSARPVFGLGLVFITTGHSQTELWAVRPGGTGDVTGTHVAWRFTDKGVPKQPSPVLVDDLLFMVSNEGIATCLDATTGQVVWAERIGGNFMASPIYANRRLYFSSVQGETTVLRAGPTFEILAENRLESGCLASPAVSGQALFLRTKTHLYRIGI